MARKTNPADQIIRIIEVIITVVAAVGPPAKGLWDKWRNSKKKGGS